MQAQSQKSKVGSNLNTSIPKILTTESLKEPMFLGTGGDKIEVLHGEQSHTYLGKKLYKFELRKLDVHCRKLLRQVVGPPGSIDWTQPWHSILHQWNERVVEQMQLNGFELWSNRCMLDYWKFVRYKG